MTAHNLAFLPDMSARMNRIVRNAKAENEAAERQLQRERNIAAEGQPVNVYGDIRVDEQLSLYETYRSAKAVVNGNDWYDPAVVHSALEFIHEYESAIPGRTETSACIAKRFRPQMLAMGAGLILAALVAVAFNMWVLP